MTVATSTLRRLLDAAERLDEYARMQPRIARCMVHPPGWRADPAAAHRLADELRGLAGALADREERVGLPDRSGQDPTERRRPRRGGAVVTRRVPR